MSQSAMPRLGAALATLHGSCAVAPETQYEPFGHNVHCVASERLLEGAYLPASQGSAADAPAAQKYPATHASHAVWPLMLWYEPPAQSVHVAALSTALNVPGAQRV